MILKIGEKMEIKTLKLGIIGENCYLLSTDKASVVIDPGFPRQEITDFLNDNKEKDRLILLTHAHFDHIGMAEELRKTTDTKIAIGVGDAPSLLDLDANMARKFRINIKPFSADITFKDGDEFSVGDIGKFGISKTSNPTHYSLILRTLTKIRNLTKQSNEQKKIDTSNINNVIPLEIKKSEKNISDKPYIYKNLDLKEEKMNSSRASKSLNVFLEKSSFSDI